MNILILDSNERCSLAAVRSLGRKNLKIFTADEFLPNLSSVSRFSSNSINYPSPYTNETGFIEKIEKEIKKHAINMLLPMTDITVRAILKHKNRFADTIIPFPDFNTYETVTDKYRLFETALSLDIPAPPTTFVENADEYIQKINEQKFPLVLKPARSRVYMDGKFHKTSVIRVNTTHEATNIINKYPWFSNQRFLVQEQVKGEGRGIFVLCKEGEIINYFAHKRIREKPPSGGVSVLSESIPADPCMLEISKKLLEPLKWNGVAMVEFKVGSDCTPYLMEINGRFWGSLQLAIESGVDFPFLLYDLFCNKNHTRISEYKTDIRLRWLLGDLDHLIINMKNPELSISKKLQSLFQFLCFFRKKQFYEIISLNDIKPFIYEMKAYMKNLFSHS